MILQLQKKSIEYMITKMFDDWIESVVERTIDKALEKALVIGQIKNNVLATANSVNQLSKTIVSVAQMVQSHHQAIIEMSAVQSHILHKIRNGGPDMTFPEIKIEKDERSNLCLKLSSFGLKNTGRC